MKARQFYYDREIWFCKLGVNIGFEEDGKGQDFLRPILVLKKLSKEVFIGLPLTTSKKVGKYYFPITPVGGKDDSVIILSQVRLIDAKRLKYRIGVLAAEEFENVKIAFVKLFK